MREQTALNEIPAVLFYPLYSLSTIHLLQFYSSQTFNHALLVFHSLLLLNSHYKQTLYFLCTPPPAMSLSLRTALPYVF